MSKIKAQESTQNQAQNTMWGGRFAHGQDSLMLAINSSIDFDKALAFEDIEGTRAHVRMLEKQAIIDIAARDDILRGLDQIESEISTGTFIFSQELEDIHMNIEARLKVLVGEHAGRCHTARSRNDQVALDFRMYVRARLHDGVKALENLIRTLLDQARAGYDRPMPGFTHLQIAQPVTFGHHMMAYVEMFGRDRTRFLDALRRLDECPLGAAALAGTGFPIDRWMTAQGLGFARPTANSIDSVSDRDFALEFLSAASITATHLSRLAEELVIWSSTQFSFVKMSDRWTTGSSIMPQKRNPDAAELIRAKVARINGGLVALLTVMKGLPLAYSKDMQEDKEQVFDAARSLLIALEAMNAMLKETYPRFDKLEEAASMGFSTATDLADWLVRVLGVPFREAHHITGRIVKMAEDKGVRLEALSLEDMQSVHPDIRHDVFDVLSVEKSIASRQSYGGTAPQNVLEQIQLWQEKLDAQL